MRYIRCASADGPRWARLEDNIVLPLSGSFPELGGETGERLNLADVRLLAPVLPPNIICVGLNYKAHAVETQADFPSAPLLFLKATTAVVGPGEGIFLPEMAPNEVDYEAELAVVIGRTTSHVKPEDSLNYVFGYTCANDVSARDAQLKIDKQWARGKSFDTFCPLGPWIETDLDPGNVSVVSRLNGQVMQSSNTSDLIFAVPELVSYISSCMTLQPGTVVMTGTPGGVGFARIPPVFLRPGDRIEVELGGIGVLENTVVA